MAARLRKQPAPATVQVASLPAPVGGLNAISAGGTVPASDCIQLFNMTPAENGLRSRLGSREWATGLTGATDDQARSLFYYHGSAKNGSKDRVFAVTSTGIWDVTTSGQYVNATGLAAWAALTFYPGDTYITSDGSVWLIASDSTSTATPPTGDEDFVDGLITYLWQGPALTREVSFGTTTGDAGRGIFHAFVGTSGHYLAYCDEENGYYLYTESTDTWAAGSTTNVTAANLVYVTSWKGRLWFIEKDTANAWYLALQAISGAATKLNLDYAAKFTHGGDLVAILSWTIDGGAGIDDQIVFLGRGGDVAIYAGTDPGAASTFALRGVWYAGALPKGRHCATRFGGDILILTKNGGIPLSKLVTGAEGLGQYFTAKIQNLFNQLMLSKSDLHGWAMHKHPEDNTLIVTHPTTDGADTEQLVMSLANGAWSRYRDLPMYSAAAGGGKLYFGSVDGVIYVNDGYVDGVTLANPNAFEPVQWSCLGGFSNLGRPTQKRIQMIRPTILTESVGPEYRTEARFKYDLTEIGSVAGGVVGQGEWDGDTWDSAEWGGEYVAEQAPSGAVGMGVDVAIAIRGTATSRTVLVGVDIAFDSGGFL
jgi:hypothetical protein